MAITIDDNFLNELGLKDLPPVDKKRLLQHVYETLELRVGTKIASVLSPEQLEDFEQFIDADDQAGAMDWLSKNYPNYPSVVAQELDGLRQEIKRDATKILALSQEPNQDPDVGR